jgi:hypothetical protein
MDKFDIKMHGRAGMTYLEGDNSIEIDSEMLNGKFDLVVYQGSVMQWSGGSNASVAEEDKARILGNVRQFLESKGLKVDWQ